MHKIGAHVADPTQVDRRVRVAEGASEVRVGIPEGEDPTPQAAVGGSSLPLDRQVLARTQGRVLGDRPGQSDHAESVGSLPWYVATEPGGGEARGECAITSVRRSWGLPADVRRLDGRRWERGRSPSLRLKHWRTPSRSRIFCQPAQKGASHPIRDGAGSSSAGPSPPPRARLRPRPLGRHRPRASWGNPSPWERGG